MSASAKTRILLAFRSGDRCALPGCGRALTVDGDAADAVVVGEAAHIAGENPGAARYDGSMTGADRDHYLNLIYLCGGCHTRIDKQEGDFPAHMLRDIKSAHENWVRQAVLDSFADIGFPELEEATRWAQQVPIGAVTRDFSLIPISDKLRKNDLTTMSHATVVMGLSVVRDVQLFIESVTQTDEGFPDRLKSGFLEQYHSLRRDGHSGDDLFDLMCRFAQAGQRSQAGKSASLAVLVYLLEACEVFEK